MLLISEPDLVMCNNTNKITSRTVAQGADLKFKTNCHPLYLVDKDANLCAHPRRNISSLNEHILASVNRFLSTALLPSSQSLVRSQVPSLAVVRRYSFLAQY